MKLVYVTQAQTYKMEAFLPIYVSSGAYLQPFLLLVAILNDFRDEKQCQSPHLDSLFAQTAPAGPTKWTVAQL
jgi:hypothetical protein